MTRNKSAFTRVPPWPPEYRYAAYFAPSPRSEWGVAGACWLGRDAFSGEQQEQPQVAGLTAEQMRQLTEAPRRYGWHATLKAPFQLCADVDAEQLTALLRTLCSGLSAFTLPRLEVRQIDDFLALVPAVDVGQMSRLNGIANDCVTGLQPLAQALSRDELDRRRQPALDAEEDAYLLRWGYPYVLNRYRFHMTLTGSLRGASDATIKKLHAGVTAHFAHLPQCEFDAVSVFSEPAPGADFVALGRVMLGA